MELDTARTIIWERQDGLYSAAVSGDIDRIREFTWFATGFSSEGEAQSALPKNHGIITTIPQGGTSMESAREVINQAVAESCHALTAEQAAESVPYGTNDLDHLTNNERAVLKDFHNDEYMDDGLETPLNYDWAVSDGVQASADVTARGASGIISSLVKKGYFTALDNGTGEDNTIYFHESARIVNSLLNVNDEAK